MSQETLLGGGRSSQSDGKTLRATIHLIRTSKDNKAVRGTATIPIGADKVVCATLENSDYIIPEGTYELKNTMSPKFKKILPLVCGVRGRSGIRFHRGTRPEHSKGCILVSAAIEQQLTAEWLALQASNEPIKITIDNEN